MSKTEVVTVMCSMVVDQLNESVLEPGSDMFTEVEIKYLKARNLRTAAGWLAVKMAVAGLFRTLGLTEPAPADIELCCDAAGRPGITALRTAEAVAAGLHISISHSRNTAHGIASLQGVTAHGS